MLNCSYKKGPGVTARVLFWNLSIIFFTPKSETACPPSIALPDLRRTFPRVLLELAAEKKDVTVPQSLCHLGHIHSGM